MNMMSKIEIVNLSGLKKAAREFAEQMGKHKVFAFHGDMGAGKTTFIKALCNDLGVSENITSPTFALVNEYLLPEGSFIYHFDCYRLKNINEAYDIGAEEYFASGQLCFIEWPEKIEALLPDDTVWVSISIQNNRRILELTFPENPRAR
jgi:tRNA threonylcarbamoyladenosine biosynthesis protein TsaE